MLKKIIRSVVNIFFPVYCLQCSALGQWLCQNCKSKLVFSSTPVVSGQPNRAIDGIWTVLSDRQKIARVLIYFLKYKGIVEIGTILGELAASYLNQKIVDFPEFKIDFIVSVPTTAKRLKWRGYNQAQIIAERLAQELNLPYKNVLSRQRQSRPQVGLTASDRRKNIRNNFIVFNKVYLTDKRVLIVDDVVTTGSTMAECAAVLKKNGVELVWGLAIIKG